MKLEKPCNRCSITRVRQWLWRREKRAQIWMTTEHSSLHKQDYWKSSGKPQIEFQMEHPEIEWGQIIGFRNRLIHGYDSIDFDIMWSIIQSDLPELVEKLEKIV